MVLMNGPTEFRILLVKYVLNNYGHCISILFTISPMKPFLFLILKMCSIIIITIFILLIFLRISLYLYASRITYQKENAPNFRTAIVFGAGLRSDGSPTSILKDRVKTAVDLYKTGKVEKILLTGDNRFVNYNEPAAMAAYAHDLGVPQTDLVLDYAGQSTYDSCYRAKSIFKLDQAILVTQSFHLPRALYICNEMGIKSIGVTADQQKYWTFSFMYWQIRELPASLVAILDVWILKPIPILGDSDPIYKDKY